MSLSSSQAFNHLIQKLNHHLLDSDQPCLNATEVLILEGIWHDQTYQEIAKDCGYSAGYFSNVVAPKLWRRLSMLTGKRVTKKNARVVLESYLNQEPVSSPPPPSAAPCFPSGAIPLGSQFYIQRRVIEEESYREIQKPGALLRIKAPQEMGKTSLLLRLLDYGNRLGYATVNLDLQQADQEILSQVNRFLRWVCANITYQLNLETKLDEYWDEDIGSSVSCSLYLHYILEQLNTPLVLAFDEVNQIFEYPKIAKSFLPLLRSWYEETKDISIWRNLRLVVIHSTEIYVPLQLNQSPFSNVGFPLELPNFTMEEVQELAQRYGLSWGEKDVQTIMSVIDGHPSLVHLSLYHLSQQEMTLEELLADAATLNGIYASHLRRHQARLQEQPDLARACLKIMKATEPVPVDSTLGYKLYSMGLIDFQRDRAFPRVPLYQQYFQQTLKHYY
ncbi:MAG: AAA-like domain-containing protein [Halothece sp. Uz-M2-17]|nr:AAA-like domain-containing protein [Halothece sp. Uz-M2-17]